MNCKFCNAEMDENLTVCPECGKEQEEQSEQLFEQTTQETAAETIESFAAVQDEPALKAVAEPQKTEKEKKNPWPMILGISGAVMGLLALAIALMVALGVDFKAMFTPKETTAPTETAGEEAAGYAPAEDAILEDPDIPNDIFAKASFTFADTVHTQYANEVVATMGDKTLTNAQLQIYYRTQVMDMLNYYSSYLTELGLDVTRPLSEQTCYYDETMSWEQFLLEEAFKTWQYYQSIGILAEEAGFEISGEWKESRELLNTSLQEQATSGGHESVEAMLKDAIGPSCTLEEYLKYVDLAYLSGAYYEQLQKELTPTDADVEEYFLANESAYADQGITMTSGNVASVRHILLTPENPIVDEETGEETYSEKDWKNCLKRAEELLEEWEKGEATEASFIALVGEHTDDPGSLTNNGLYEDISPTSNYVEPFRNWAVDITRVPGETAIVKTQFGYHIMYYVSGEPEWKLLAQSALINQIMTEATENAKAKWPMEVNYKRIVLRDLHLAD